MCQGGVGIPAMFFTELLSACGLANAWGQGLLFVFASLLMIWRLEALIDRGLEGTALATVVTPFCSGLGNLLFVWFMLDKTKASEEVLTNCLVNNVTNMTLLLGLPALIWGLRVVAPKNSSKGRGKASKVQVEQRISRLSLLLTFAAAAFFSGAVWVLGADGSLAAQDGLILCGLFVFWLCFQIFDVLKTNVRKARGFSPFMLVDLALLGLGALAMYESLDWLVSWLSARKEGFLSVAYLGWITAFLMVLPNALLVFWYAARGRADVAYASQVGDGHVCIPLCLGLYALFRPLQMPALLESGMLVLLGATLVHFLFLSLWGGLPRWAGALLLGGYGFFLWSGFA